MRLHLRNIKWRGKGAKWTAADEQLVRQLIKQGKRWDQCIYLFPTRTRDALRNKFKWERNGGGYYMPAAIPRLNPPIPVEVLDSRDLRANEPRSLTATICGDPPFSQSALGKRSAMVSVDTESHCEANAPVSGS